MQLQSKKAPEQLHAFTTAGSHSSSQHRVCQAAFWAGPFGSEQTRKLVQTLHQSASSPGWNCGVLALVMSHLDRSRHPFSSHNPKAWLPRHTTQAQLGGTSSAHMGQMPTCPLKTPEPETQLHSREPTCTLRGYRLQGLAYRGIHSQ